MSADEKDTEKGFLSRWSQRKREAKVPDADTAAARAEKEEKASLAQIAESETEEEFDLSSLPKLEEITEGTDIAGFLRKGVPESVRNAALRKSWALDPAIRNYVNPALDYAYDWNTPGGVPGSGELAAGTDIAKMVLQIMGSDPAADSAQASETQPPGDAADAACEIAAIDAPQNPEPDLPLQAVRLSSPAALASDHGGQPEQWPAENVPGMPATPGAAPQQQVRRHGTAKPRA